MQDIAWILRRHGLHLLSPDFAWRESLYVWPPVINYDAGEHFSFHIRRNATLAGNAVRSFCIIDNQKG